MPHGKRDDESPEHPIQGYLLPEETVMSKQHFAGFLAALVVTAVQFYAIEAGSASKPQDRGNPAVAEESSANARLAGSADASPLRHNAA
jgi:hypothetical protein